MKQEESYTSQASFDDGDFPSKQFKISNGGFSGHIPSGNDENNLYRRYVTAHGYHVHRDINAAANILKKYSAALAKRENVRVFNPVVVKW